MISLADVVDSWIAHVVEQHHGGDGHGSFFCDFPRLVESHFDYCESIELDEFAELHGCTF